MAEDWASETSEAGMVAYLGSHDLESQEEGSHETERGGLER